jgi:hypothetical protein
MLGVLKRVDGSTQSVNSGSLGSVTMGLGDSFRSLYAYTAKAPLGVANYNGQLAYCVQAENVLYGANKYTGLDGSCWISQDSTNKLLNGAGKKFCCNSQACVNLGLSSDYVCQNFECTYKGTVTGGCNQPTDCGALKDYVTDVSSQAYQIEATCDKSKPQPGWLGTCGQIKTAIACDPSLTYADNKCCKFQNGAFGLTDCTGTLSDCRATLGADACCLETQSSYTVKTCESGLQCCGSESDGLGTCAETCEAKGLDLFAGLEEFLQSALGVGAATAKILMWVLIALAVIIVIYLLAGKGGMGGGGVSTTIVNIPPSFYGGRR